jgi:hypothetical protein
LEQGPGQTIFDDKYRILRLIGKGGMSRAWLACPATVLALLESATWLDNLSILRHNRTVSLPQTAYIAGQRRSTQRGDR